MNVRPVSHVMAVLVVAALVVLTMSALSTSDAAPGGAGRPETISVSVPVLPGEDTEPIKPPEPQQGIDIVRVHSESFEDPGFPSITTSKWTVADRCSIFPGRADVVAWGRRTCDASAGRASLWAVGGGTWGKELACGAKYPGDISDPRRTCSTVNTLLRYTTFDMSGQACMRVTFDLKAQMPQGALRMAIGERDDEGNITFTQQFADFTTDTAGEWERGIIRNFPDAARKPRVVLGFFYLDESGTGGYEGATIDNVLVDALQNNCNVPPIPSPTSEFPSPTSTEDMSGTATATNTPFVLPPSKTPGTPSATPTPRRPWISMPLVVRRTDLGRVTVPPPPTPTITPTPSATPTVTNTSPPPTETERPTRTPRPTEPPTITPRPTPTDVPKPDVQIVDILFMPIEPGTSLEVVTLTNVGTAAQLMDQWRLFNLSHSEICRFPAGLEIQAGASYEIRSGRDAVTDATGVACTNENIWNNQRDEGQLYDEFNTMRSCLAYDENGPYNCMPAP